MGEWYCYRYTMASSTIRNEGALTILHAMNSLAKTRPQRKAAVDVYSAWYYKTHVKHLFDQKWAEIKDSQPDGAHVNECKNFIWECWNKESPDIRAEIESEVEETYNKELADYNTSGDWILKTARKFHEVWDDAPTVLAPFADVVGQQFGAQVVMFLIAPTKLGNMGAKW